MHIVGIPEGKEVEKGRIENFSKLMSHQTTGPGSSENIKENNAMNIIFKLQKIKDKKKILKKPEEKNSYLYRSKDKNYI